MNERFDEWPRLLSDFITEHAFKKFEWGVNDCCLFAANCVLELTGFDPAENYRGKYKTENGAKKIIDLHKGLESLVTFGMGIEPSCNFLSAKRGDVVLADVHKIEFIGIVDDSGAGVLFFNHKFEMDRASLAQVKRVWSY